MELIQFRPEGMYVPPADVYIDPYKPVKKALITHAHSDHARWGMEEYIAEKSGLPLLKHRLGDVKLSGFGYGDEFEIKGVKFSFHPSGHVPGSAQLRVEHQGEVWVAAGDYKVVADGLSKPFEPVKCDVFITESTFGLPVYRWRPQEEIMQEINSWWKENQERGLCSVMFAYSLGKAQRILQGVDHSIGKVWVHGAVANMNQACEAGGYALKPWSPIPDQPEPKQFRRDLIIAPPSAAGTSWLKKFEPYSDAQASGWMAVRGTRRRLSADRGFVLSDHADWPGLLQAIEQTEAKKILVSHGFTDVFSRYLNENGWDARAV
ncbi:MAG: ligase-associated DNA damage response exonuclease [Bacteroidetes bacterium]|nr:ligase-associated DNA damage response exonuclease [Bacteroidota bacterium]MCK6611003.1 ligase-associated DNA damage response exonuclease [Bacteroidia bacterium]